MNVRRKKSRCHLAAWDSYELEIAVKMKNGMWGSPAQVILLGDRSFANFTLNIYPGDKIWFAGQLTNDANLQADSLLGGANPHVYLEEVGCHVCHTIDLKTQKRNRHKIKLNDVIRGFYQGFKTILNFLCNPIVIFK